MTLAVILRPEASEDLTDAYLWYEDKRHGLGEEFLLVVDAAIEKIRRSPDAYPIIHRNVRRVLTRRFPYFPRSSRSARCAKTPLARISMKNKSDWHRLSTV